MRPPEIHAKVTRRDQLTAKKAMASDEPDSAGTVKKRKRAKGKKGNKGGRGRGKQAKRKAGSSSGASKKRKAALSSSPSRRRAILKAEGRKKCALASHEKVCRKEGDVDMDLGRVPDALPVMKKPSACRRSTSAKASTRASLPSSPSDVEIPSLENTSNPKSDLLSEPKPSKRRPASVKDKKDGGKAGDVKKTFARRYQPTAAFPLKKWNLLKELFEYLVKPRVVKPSSLEETLPS